MTNRLVLPSALLAVGVAAAGGEVSPQAPEKPAVTLTIKASEWNSGETVSTYENRVSRHAVEEVDTVTAHTTLGDDLEVAVVEIGVDYVDPSFNKNLAATTEITGAQLGGSEISVRVYEGEIQEFVAPTLGAGTFCSFEVKFSDY